MRLVVAAMPLSVAHPPDSRMATRVPLRWRPPFGWVRLGATASVWEAPVSQYPTQVDAVVIGAGPNGLVAANALCDAGWEVLVLEANDTVGGAVRSRELVREGFVSDLYSAFYPLAAASPVIRGLDLEQHGLHWEHAPDVLAHPLEDGRCAVLSRSLDRTAASLESFAAGDGDAWRELFALWLRVRDPLLDALFTPFPPVWSMLRMLRRLGSADALDTARFLALPVRRMVKERFSGDGAMLLLTGNALHADVMPDAAVSGAFGWLMCMLGQDFGFPVPRGGAQRLADALAARVSSRGGDIRVASRVDRVLLEGGGPPGCGWPTAPQSGRGGPSWPTSRRRRSTATWSATTGCRRCCGGGWTGSSWTGRR